MGKIIEVNVSAGILKPATNDRFLGPKIHQIFLSPYLSRWLHPRTPAKGRSTANALWNPVPSAPAELNALREGAIKANLFEQVPRAGPRGEDGWLKGERCTTGGRIIL